MIAQNQQDMFPQELEAASETAAAAVVAEARAKAAGQAVAVRSSGGSDFMRMLASNDDGAQQGGDEWPEPLPVTELAQAQPFNAAELLPPVLADMVQVTAARQRTQPEKVMVPLYTALASQAAHCNFLRPDPADNPDWREWTNMYGLLIDEPGTRKTPALQAALRYVASLGEGLRERHEAQAQEAKDALTAYEVAKENIKAVARKDKVCSPDEVLRRMAEAGLGDEPPVPGAAPVVTASEATPQVLEVKLAANPALWVVWDETRGFFAALRDRDMGERIRTIIKHGFSHSKLMASTLKRGDVAVECPRPSFFGNVQNDVMRRAIIEAKGNDDGLFSRFQLSVFVGDAPRIKKWAVPPEIKTLEPLANQHMQTVADWLCAQALKGEECEWRFDDEAQALFIAEWEREQERAEKERDTFPPLLAAHFGKRTSFIARAALMEAVLRVATYGDDGKRLVRREELERAIGLADWLRPHAFRMYGWKNPAHALLEKLKSGDGSAGSNAIGDGFTLRDVLKHEWAGLKTKEQAQVALDELVRCRWLRVKKQGAGERGGRPTVRYWLHQALLAKRSGKV